MKSQKFHIGTSGWHYDHWVGKFYPKKSSKESMLEYYSGYFQTVEINNSFYQLPSEKSLQTWKNTVDSDFVFSVKASRYITHMRKLKNAVEPLKRFLGEIETLGENLGPILFQLPPRWHVNCQRLSEFIKILPDAHKYTFEFRDETWFDGDIYKILSDNNIAFCIYEIAGNISPEPVTADFVYLRMHGPTESAYEGSYTPQKLTALSKKIQDWINDGKTVYCYFDNDQHGYAVENGLSLKEYMGNR